MEYQNQPRREGTEMSQAFMLRKEFHKLDDKIQRLAKELHRLEKQKKVIGDKLLHLSMEEAASKMDVLLGDELI